MRKLPLSIAAFAVAWSFPQVIDRPDPGRVQRAERFSVGEILKDLSGSVSPKAALAEDLPTPAERAAAKAKIAQKREEHLDHVVYRNEDHRVPESYSVDGQKLEFPSSDKVFFFVALKDTMALDNLIRTLKLPEKPEPIGFGDSRFKNYGFVVVRLSHLRMAVKKYELVNVAKKDNFPRFGRVRTFNGRSVLHTGEVTLMPKKGKEDVVRALAVRHGLEEVKVKEDEGLRSLGILRFDVPPGTSDYKNPFAASRSLMESEDVEFCEPVIIQKLIHGDDDGKNEEKDLKPQGVPSSIG